MKPNELWFSDMDKNLRMTTEASESLNDLNVEKEPIVTWTVVRLPINCYLKEPNCGNELFLSTQYKIMALITLNPVFILVIARSCSV